MTNQSDKLVLSSVVAGNTTDTNILVISGANVGIGTTSPSSNLHVHGAGGTGVVTQIKVTQADDGAGHPGADAILQSSGWGEAFLKLSGHQISAAGGDMNITSTTDLALQTGGTNTRMFIDGSTGKVGIGTTNPGKELDVVGTIRAADAGGSNQHQLRPTQLISYGTDAIINAQSADSDVRLNTQSSTVLTAKADGKVGIGTTTPTNELEVLGGGSPRISLRTTSETVGEALELGFQVGTGVNSSANSVGIIKSVITQANPSALKGDLVFQTNSGDSVGTKMVIKDNGNVGIGTTSPSYKLSVAGGIAAGGKVTYTKSAGSLDTTGFAVAGLTTSSNGLSAGFTFTCFGHTGGYQKIVYSCANVSGTWNTFKVIDEGTNQLDIEASTNGTTITFTFKSRSGTMYYTPRVTIEATGSAINNTYA